LTSTPLSTPFSRFSFFSLASLNLLLYLDGACQEEDARWPTAGEEEEEEGAARPCSVPPLRE